MLFYISIFLLTGAPNQFVAVCSLSFILSKILPLQTRGPVAMASWAQVDIVKPSSLIYFFEINFMPFALEFENCRDVLTKNSKRPLGSLM